MSNYFPIHQIRELRGSPITILLAIILLEQSGQVPVTAQLLKDVTGYKDHTITDSLRLLTLPERQMLTRVRGGWRLAMAFQIPLLLENRDIRENRVIREFPPSSCSSSKNLLVNPDSEEQEEEIIEIREIRDSDAFRANYKTAVELGIRDPKASQLAALPHVTPEYIQAHIDQVNDQDLPIGTAIYRIMHKWAPRIDKAKSAKKEHAAQIAGLMGHEPGCKCSDCILASFGLPVCPDCHHVYQNCECEEGVSVETEEK